MRRRIFLALILCVAAASARAQTAQPVQPLQPTQQVPGDRISLEEFKALRAAGKIFVLDVRYGVDRKIKGATYIPLDQLESRLGDLPRDREIITYCS